MSEFWDIPVQEVTILENDPNHQSVSDFRLKLMEIADKVEAGIYTAANINLLAANFEKQEIVTGELVVHQLDNGSRETSWVDITATIEDSENFRHAYYAFIEDTMLMYSQQHIDGVDTCEVTTGSNRSDGDTTRYVKESSK